MDQPFDAGAADVVIEGESRSAMPDDQQPDVYPVSAKLVNEVARPGNGLVPTFPSGIGLPDAPVPLSMDEFIWSPVELTEVAFAQSGVEVHRNALIPERDE